MSKHAANSIAPPMETTPMIYAALANVAQDVRPVGKGGKNREQGYSFRKAEDVLASVKAALDAHGVITVHRIADYERTQFTTAKGTVGHCVLLKQITSFYAPDGSSVETESWGEGMDYSDKATNKAMTQATKYTYVRTFNIAEEGLDIADAESPEAARAEKPSPPSTAAPLPDKSLSEHATRTIAQIWKATNEAELEAVIDREALREWDDGPDKDAVRRVYKSRLAKLNAP